MTVLPDYTTILTPLGVTVRLNEPLARYTAARLGGAADALVVVESADFFERVARAAWAAGWQTRILGGGANVLVRDEGVRGLVIINDAKAISIDPSGVVTVESGFGLISLARQTMTQGLGGFEWAINVPGTVGGEWSITPERTAAIWRAAYFGQRWQSQSRPPAAGWLTIWHTATANRH